MEFSQFPMAHIDLYCSLMLCPYASESFSQHHKGIELLFMKDARMVRDFLLKIRIQEVESGARSAAVLISRYCPLLLLKSIWRNGRKANVVVFLFYITDGDDKVLGNFYVYTRRSRTQGTATTESKKMTSFSG